MSQMQAFPLSSAQTIQVWTWLFSLESREVKVLLIDLFYIYLIKNTVAYTTHTFHNYNPALLWEGYFLLP